MTERNEDFSVSPSKEWPFKSLEVGEVVALTGEDRMKGQQYCHTYGRQSGKKFVSKSGVKDGEKCIYFKRVK